MALANEPALEGLQTLALYGNVQELDPFSLELFTYKGHNHALLEDGEGSESFGSYSGGFLPMLSDPSNSSGGSFVFGSVDSPPQEAFSIINVKPGSNHWACSGSSVLSFEQGDEDAMDQNYRSTHFDMKRCTESRLIQGQSCFDVGSEYKLASNAMNDERQNKEQFGLPCLGASAGDGPRESAEQEKRIQKHPYTDGDLQASKKHCSNTRKSKAKPSPSKDPQSIAAKNRREQISERLKILQDLVPNGSKVDLVTMLEKAISYVKFLQLQVKVLATDEFWPAQGGKAPEGSQVKEAIDAILLSSHRNKNSSS